RFRLRDAGPGRFSFRQPEFSGILGSETNLRPSAPEPAMSPLPAPKALDNFFLEARCRLLDLAAILDRIGRGRDASSASGDPRLDKIRKALEVLHDQSGGR